MIKNHISIRFTLLCFLILLCLKPLQLQAQRNSDELKDLAKFRTAVELYGAQQYTEAISVFKEIDTADAALFAAKCEYELSHYNEAKKWIGKIKPVPQYADVFREGMYLYALCDIQLRYFAQAITSLDLLKNQLNASSSLYKQANNRLNELLSYIDVNERIAILKQSKSESLIEAVIEHATRVESQEDLAKLYRFIDSNRVALNSSLRSNLFRLKSDSTFFANYSNRRDRDYPSGLAVKMNLMLPKFDVNTAEFDIIQGFYYGVFLAIEEHNNSFKDQPVFLSYTNTMSDTSLADQWRKTLKNISPDLILGPLFSESLTVLSKETEKAQIPLLAPLANADVLADDANYSFQFNPTFATRGKQAAAFMIDSLKIDSIAVFVENNSLGYSSALAFKEVAEKKGADIIHFVADDFEAHAYDLTPYEDYMSIDSTLIDSLGFTYYDGVYAPFSGVSTQAMIDLLLTGLKSQNNFNVTIYGSEEWKNHELNGDQINDFNIWVDAFQSDENTSDAFGDFVNKYENAFGNSPNRQSILGYDMATYVLKILENVKNPKLIPEGIRNSQFYEGFITNFDFHNSQINQALFIQQKVK